jgi:hypothetical protein
MGESGTGRRQLEYIYSWGKGNKRYVLLGLLACLSVVPRLNKSVDVICSVVNCFLKLKSAGQPQVSTSTQQ